ncbi:hypothetical protein CsSME_00018827 [Camellia sinensis var. sinensis]
MKHLKHEKSELLSIIHKAQNNMQDRLKASARMGNIKQYCSPLKNTSRTATPAHFFDQNSSKLQKQPLNTLITQVWCNTRCLSAKLRTKLTFEHSNPHKCRERGRYRERE